MVGRRHVIGTASFLIGVNEIMKKAIMYGAGNIGRGFIGKTFSQSGYEVCFVDVIKKVVKELNDKNQYPVKIISNEGHAEQIVRNVRAVSGFDIEKVAKEIANADVMATAVGVNILPKIVKPICAGLKKRFEQNDKPLNIIICENLINADKYLRKLIEDEMGIEYKDILDKKLGLIEASIGRMVPVMTSDMQEGNMLRVWVEPYDELPVDKDAFVGEIPNLKNLVPFSPFGFYIKRKLFIHNLGHTMCAYFGWQKGYEYIYECIDDKKIRSLVEAAMKETAMALNNEYGIAINEINDNIYDLLHRFSNRVLGDTVTRVGKDPLRKLGNNDRLVGAALYCEKNGIEPNNIIKGIAVALKYNNNEDESAVKIQKLINEKGLEECIEQICGLDKDTFLSKEIIRNYKSII